MLNISTLLNILFYHCEDSVFKTHMWLPGHANRIMVTVIDFHHSLNIIKLSFY